MDLLNISEAKATLSAVVDKVVKTGEACIIGKAGKPMVKLVPYEPSPAHKRLGGFEGQAWIADDWDEWPDDIAIALGIKDK